MSASAVPSPTDDRQARAVFSGFGGPELLSTERDVVPPAPGPGEARIRVEASSVQFTDTLIRRGLYPDVREKPPLVPGYDVVGVVDAVGEGVTSVAVGDRVADLVTIGGNARYAVRPAAGLVPVPASVDAAEAATLVLSWQTAFQALHREAQLRAGERVLVVGGSGAVGLAVIALARLAGAEVEATASARHHDRLRAMGAVPLPRDAVPEPDRYDVVVDGVAVDAFRSSYRALRKGGRLVAIGFSAAAAAGRLWPIVVGYARVALAGLWPDGRSSGFYSITARRKKQPGEFREDLAALFGMLERGEIAPVVGRRIGFEEIAAVHAELEAGGVVGKVVLEPWGR